MSAEEFADAQAELHCVEAWIYTAEACVGNVQIAEFEAPIIFRAQDVCAEGGRGREVYFAGEGGNVVVGEQHATSQFEIGRKTAMALEVPLEAEGIEAHTIGSVGRLENQEHRHSVHYIFEASAENAGKMRAGEDPTVSESGIENSGASGASRDGVAGGGPDLQFSSAVYGTRINLGGAEGGSGREDENGGNQRTHDFD